MAQIDSELTRIPDVEAQSEGVLAGRGKFLVGGLIIIAAIVFLVVNTFQATAVFYLTPSELLDQASSLYGEDMRLAGTIDKRSAEWDAESVTLKFDVFEGRDVVPVVYNGPKPDTFEMAEAVTIEGVYRQDGVFEAKSLFLQCPSKYEAELEEK
ncbi:MAG: Cytochrome c-type biogenesis protein CcmE [Anaerolineales bacterium]|nr:Cytochrome c-type biogenesis protein CcmE [Anaerolineales bacterium]